MADGKIHNLELYAKAKLLDFSGWKGKLPRNITPSDIDMVFDTGKKLLFCELKSWKCGWGDLSIGQRILYDHMLQTSRGKMMVAICYHSLPEGRQIDTTTDILEFQFAFRNNCNVLRVSEWIPGAAFVPFVQYLFTL